MHNALLEFTDGRSLEELCDQACSIRDRGKGRIVSFSPKVFIPLTRLCRDFCSYCVFRQSPQQAEALYMSPDRVLEVARAGQRAGCREALFVLGERPEQRYSEAREWLKNHGYESTIHYLREMCELVLRETDLYPHSNPGTMTHDELQTLKEVNLSMGLMLESTSQRLYQPGGPHEHAPSKRPKVRLRTLELAGELRIPFTTGLLVGIGETPQERIEALLAIKDLHERFGHIQELIIQNFCAKPATPMEKSAEASPEEMRETVALARIILGPEMNVQVPPNLSPHYLVYLEAGINDWGGISPVTKDYVNPEATWPHIAKMQQEMKDRGYQLRARFPLYPEYFLEKSHFLPQQLLERLRTEADPQGYFAGHDWSRYPIPAVPAAPGSGSYHEIQL
ncbi:7,8-didemethyl-8-hydroxy-5-deazariboflavin synthase CofG [Acidobacteria bacterium AH-259-D05]|nr:7,8-didemethyl-8-hydroxy-5-deazariboflavin synthase CofG [Acidobacteria bacterium AH-259-D05]